MWNDIDECMPTEDGWYLCYAPTYEPSFCILRYEVGIERFLGGVLVTHWKELYAPLW